MDRAATLTAAAALTEFLGLRDFREQKGRLQEEVEALGNYVLFYPKFRCELNLLNATGVEPNGLQEKIAGTTLKHSRRRCPSLSFSSHPRFLQVEPLIFPATWNRRV